MISLVTSNMLEKIGFGMSSCSQRFGFTQFIILETKGKILEELDEVFGDLTAHEGKTRLFRIAQSLGLEEAEYAAHDKKAQRAMQV